jgi:hypothetical protein
MELAERLAVVSKGAVVSAAKYKFEWLVGDAALEKPLSWSVGLVEMTLAQLPKIRRTFCMCIGPNVSARYMLAGY